MPTWVSRHFCARTTQYHQNDIQPAEHYNSISDAPHNDWSVKIQDPFSVAFSSLNFATEWSLTCMLSTSLSDESHITSTRRSHGKPPPPPVPPPRQPSVSLLYRMLKERWRRRPDGGRRLKPMALPARGAGSPAQQRGLKSNFRFLMVYDDIIPNLHVHVAIIEFTVVWD